MPIETADGAGALDVLSAYAGRFFKMFMRSAAASASAAANGSRLGGPAQSSLTGRVLFRSNERPQATLDAIIAGMGTDFYHIRSQPSVLSVLKMRMGRGAQMATTFKFKHYASDSTWMEAMHELQVKNTPNMPGVKMTEADVIDCGFRSGQRRKRYETTFTVIFPDVKDGMDHRIVGDVTPDQAYVAGTWHPQSHLTKLDMPLLITNAAAASSQASSNKAASKDKAAPAKEASGGVLGGIMRRMVGGGGGAKDAAGGEGDGDDM